MSSPSLDVEQNQNIESGQEIAYSNDNGLEAEELPDSPECDEIKQDNEGFELQTTESLDDGDGEDHQEDGGLDMENLEEGLSEAIEEVIKEAEENILLSKLEQETEEIDELNSEELLEDEVEAVGESEGFAEKKGVRFCEAQSESEDGPPSLASSPQAEDENPLSRDNNDDELNFKITSERDTAGAEEEIEKCTGKVSAMVGRFTTINQNMGRRVNPAEEILHADRITAKAECNEVVETANQRVQRLLQKFSNSSSC